MAGEPRHVVPLALPANEDVDRAFFGRNGPALHSGKDREQELELLVAIVVADDFPHPEPRLPEVLAHGVPAPTLMIDKPRILFDLAGSDQPVAPWQRRVEPLFVGHIEPVARAHDRRSGSRPTGADESDGSSDVPSVAPALPMAWSCRASLVVCW